MMMSFLFTTLKGAAAIASVYWAIWGLGWLAKKVMPRHYHTDSNFGMGFVALGVLWMIIAGVLFCHTIGLRLEM